MYFRKITEIFGIAMTAQKPIFKNKKVCTRLIRVFIALWIYNYACFVLTYSFLEFDV